LQGRGVIAPSYNDEIEVTRNSRPEIGEFGPLGYVFLIVTFILVVTAERMSAMVRARLASMTVTSTRYFSRPRSVSATFHQHSRGTQSPDRTGPTSCRT
jgi:hypothetical protein